MSVITLSIRFRLSGQGQFAQLSSQLKHVNVIMEDLRVQRMGCQLQEQRNIIPGKPYLKSVIKVLKLP